MRVDLEPCFILHSRPYRNTSLLVELLSKQYGRISAVARSARGPKSRYKGCLQPFVPLLISWCGRKELMQLGAVELQSMPYSLNGIALISGFYLNELLMRLLPRHDEYLKIFDQYQLALQALVTHQALEQHLRCFEKQLLVSLGYGFTLNYDDRGEPIEEAAWYQLIPNQGLSRCSMSSTAHIFCGRSILALHYNQLDDEQSLQDAKRLMRLALAHYLGTKPLKSRELIGKISNLG
jgi:DNA repair protein RecO (recombination protein O)